LLFRLHTGPQLPSLQPLLAQLPRRVCARVHRKHSQLIIYDSVATNASRSSYIRNFNDLTNDLVNGTLPQWLFITPNMVNDGHDTTIDFVSDWLSYFLVPLLNDTRFNTEKTLVLLTFDENETYEDENVIYTVLLGGAVPKDKVNTTDDTFYTHYSALSTVQANWGLGSLGRQDTNKSVFVSLFSSFIVAHTMPQDGLERLRLRRLPNLLHERRRPQIRATAAQPHGHLPGPALLRAVHALRRTQHLGRRRGRRQSPRPVRTRHELRRVQGRVAAEPDGERGREPVAGSEGAGREGGGELDEYQHRTEHELDRRKWEREWRQECRGGSAGGDSVGCCGGCGGYWVNAVICVIL
jgi:hypothetical protein